MKKTLLMLFLISLLAIPIVYGVTQSFINKHNLNQPNNPVVVASNNSFSLSVSRAGRTLIGVATPQVGDVVRINYNDGIIYNFSRVMHDNLAYYNDYNLQGSSFYGYSQWLQNSAELIIDTAGFTPGWHHVFIYSAKFNPTSWTFSNASWKAFSFEVQPKTPPTPTPNFIIGPLNCVRPQQSQTQVWQIDKDTTLCSGGFYNVPLGIEIIKDGVIFDCDGAELNGTRYVPATVFSVQANKGVIKNCVFSDIDVELLGNNILFENNKFKVATQFVSNLDLHLSGSDNILRGNVLSFVGLYDSVDNKLVDNKIIGSMQLIRSNKNEVINNDIEEKQNGLFLRDSSDNLISDNRIILNSIKQNIRLINIKDGKGNIVKNNFIDGKNNVRADGIYILGVDDGQFYGNSIKNTNVAINVVSPNENNEFVKNNLIDNQIQIHDSTDNQNIYENNYITGFSDDPSQCNDQNKDDICDNAYEISVIPAQYSSTGQTIIIQDPAPSAVPN